MESRSTIKVVIPEAIPSLNKGEAAILEGIHAMLSWCGQYEITLFSPDSWMQDDSRNYRNIAKLVGGTDLGDQGNELSQKPVQRCRVYYYIRVCKLLAFGVLSRVSRGLATHVFRDELFASILDADIILAGHDGMMGAGQCHIVRAGRIMNKAVVFCGSGKGSNIQLGSRRKRQMKYAVDNSICCTVRDRETHEYLRSCEVDETRVRLAPDPAVLLLPCEDTRVTEILESQGIPASTRRHMCAIVTAEGGIVPRESYAGESNPDAKRRLRVELWKELVSHLVNTTDAYVVFLPHCIGPSPRNDDRRMAKDIYDALACDKDRVKCIEEEYSAGELKGLMKRCQLVLSERAHAAIGAFSTGTPCIGFTVNKDRRMHNIINAMFERPVYDLDDPNVSQLKALITDEWNNRQQTSAAMAGHVERIIEQAHAAAKWMHGRIEESLYHQ